MVLKSFSDILKVVLTHTAKFEPNGNFELSEAAFDFEIFLTKKLVISHFSRASF